MSNTKDGGPAFPVPEMPFADGSRYLRTDSPGMSLRDYFAAKALAVVNMNDYSTMMRQSSARYRADQAYEIADAMLKAREA